jgi:hypothetical protein
MASNFLYKEENNVGLPYDFRLKDGKFELTGGTEKAEKNMFMWLNFMGWFRVYFEDFVPDILRLLQKPASFLEAAKVLLLGRLQDSAITYLPDIDIQEMNIEKLSGSRKDYVIGMKFAYKLEPTTSLTAITFITI